jgi:hypothetical protein
MAITDLEMIPLKLTGDSLHGPTAGHSMQRGSRRGRTPSCDAARKCRLKGRQKSRQKESSRAAVIR